jgi:hypothetical protein
VLKWRLNLVWWYSGDGDDGDLMLWWWGRSLKWKMKMQQK